MRQGAASVPATVDMHPEPLHRGQVPQLPRALDPEVDAAVAVPDVRVHHQPRPVQGLAPGEELRDGIGALSKVLLAWSMSR